MKFCIPILVLSLCPAKGSRPDLETVLMNAKPTATKVLLDQGVPEVARMKRLGSSGLILFSIRDKTIHHYDLMAGRLELVAREGEGPGELRGGLVYGSVVGNQIVVHELATSYTKAFRLGQEPVVVSKNRWGFKSWIQFGEGRLIAVLPAAGSLFLEGPSTQKVGTVPKDSLAFFVRGKPGEPWELHGTFYDEDAMGEDDDMYNITTNLFVIPGTERFFRVPYYGSPILQIMDSSGQVVRELPIPHPFASQNPKDPFLRLEKIKAGKILTPIRTASIDAKGRLHVLLDQIGSKDADWSQRLIIIMDEFGAYYGAYTVDRQVYRMTVSHDGSHYYAIDFEDGYLVRLDPQD